MKNQKFERENKKIILGMVIGTFVSVALLLWYIGSGSGWHLDIMQIIIALALGLVMGTLFGGLIAVSLISNRVSFPHGIFGSSVLLQGLCLYCLILSLIGLPSRIMAV